MLNSYGFIETRGLTAAIEAADAMVKAAKVHIIKVKKSGGALITVIVEGDLAACQAAVDAGKSAAQCIGKVVSHHVIARPVDDTEFLVKQLLTGNFRGKRQQEITNSNKTRNPIKEKQAKKMPVSGKKPDNSQKILALLRSDQTGLTLQEISDKLGVILTEVRKVIKKLVDSKLIEKVHQKYYLMEN
ncbi:MAG: BMC domain-containing protein [Calditrichaceae bacterium]